MFEEEETFPVGKEISTSGFVKLYHMQDQTFLGNRSTNLY